MRLVRFAVCLTALVIAAVETRAQARNEVGLEIGVAAGPGRTLGTDRVSLAPSLALGAEYDYRLSSRKGLSIHAGADFLASPLDVKLRNPPSTVVGQYAYVFLTPHLRVKLRMARAVSPWLELGGGYARFLEGKPAAAPEFVPGTNTGTWVFGGGIDTAPAIRLFRIPVGFRASIRDFRSGPPRYRPSGGGGPQDHVVVAFGFLLRL